MPFMRNSDWSLNKGADLVYSFVDGITKRYRKIDGCIYEVIQIKDAGEAMIAVPSSEFSVEQFDFFKAWSDDNYQNVDKADVSYYGIKVNFADLENTTVTATFPSEQKKDEEAFTVADAMSIFVSMKLTEVQKRRFIAVEVKGQKMIEVARQEKVGHSRVKKSIEQAKKKRERALKKFFKKNFKNRGSKTPKKP